MGKEKVKMVSLNVAKGDAALFAAGCFFVILAFGMFLTNLYVSGYICAAIAILLVLPVNRILRKAIKVELSNSVKAAVSGVMFLILLIVAGFENQPTGGGLDLLGTYQVGQEFTVESSYANFTFAVAYVNITDVLVIDSVETPANGIYILVACTVENMGNQPYYYLPGFIYMADSADRLFTQVAYSGFSTLIQPGLSIGAVLVFDVPEDAAGLILRVFNYQEGSAWDTYNEVELGI